MRNQWAVEKQIFINYVITQYNLKNYNNELNNKLLLKIKINK